MHRTRVAVVLGVLLSLVVPGSGARAAEDPTPSLGWASDAPAIAPHGGGHDTLPIHAAALARAKERANEHASPGGPGGGDRGITGALPAFNGQKDSQITPPDTTGAIGPSSYIELVNLQYGFYDRAGNVIAQGPLSDLTNINQLCLTDPQVIWDPDGARFFYVALDACDDTFAFGFSKGSAPTAAADSQWCKYTAFGYGSLLPDFPKLGDSGDFLMIGTNVFQQVFFTPTYLRSDVDWIAKADLVLGTGASCPDPGTIHAGVFGGVQNQDGSDASTPVPANGVEFASPTGYVVAGPDASSSPGGVASTLTIFKVTNDGSGNAVLSAPATVNVPNYSVPPDAPQRRTKKRLDTSDARLTQAVAAFDPSEGRVGVWTQHAVAGGAGSEVRWYEIAPNGALLDSGKATSSTLYAYNAAISPDRAVASSTQSAFGGSMALTLNTSSANAFTAIQMITKPVGGSQTAMVKIAQSPGRNLDFSCTPACRWGDYAGASPDPAGTGTSGTVWLANQWNVKSVSASDVDWRTIVWNVSP